jgi:hypothetical protein
MGKKAAEEKALREKIAVREDLKDALAAFDRIAAAQKVIAERWPQQPARRRQRV